MYIDYISYIGIKVSCAYTMTFPEYLDTGQERKVSFSYMARPGPYLKLSISWLSTRKSTQKI